MFTEEMLGLVLWAPYALIALIAAIIFCANGYRKGIWRALLSLGATVVSALVSVLIASLASEPVVTSASPMIIDLLTEQFGPDETAMMGMALELIQGIVRGIVALVLFGVVFFILTIILKIVSAKVKKDALQVEENGLRFAGLGVRLLDTLLYTLILLLPLYGTLSAYVPAASAVMNSSLIEIEGMEEVDGYLNTISDHALVKTVKHTPLASAYSKLTEFKYGEDGKAVSPVQIASTVEKAVGYAENLYGKDLTTLGKEDVEMIKFLREEIVGANWVYPIVKEALNGVRNDYPAYGGLIDTYMKSPDVFENNVNAVLDLAEFLLEKELIAVIVNSENSLELLLDSGFDAEIGKFLNSTDEIVSVKNGAIDGIVMSMAGQGEIVDQIRETLLSGFSDDPITDKGDQKKEGRAILLLVLSTNSEIAQLGNILEALATHPMIGADRVGQFITSTEMIDGIDETILNKLIDKLKQCTTEGYEGPRFAEYYSAIEGLITMISTENITELIKNGEANLYFLDVDADAVKFASELFNEFLAGMGGEEGTAGSSIIGDVLAALPEELEKLKDTEGFVPEKEYQSVATMMEIAQIATSEPEKLDELIDSYASENRIEINGEVIEDPLAWYAESELIPSLLENVMDKNGEDPLGIGESLTQEQKDEFSGYLDDYVKEMFPEGNADLQEDLDTLKAFLGM